MNLNRPVVYIAGPYTNGDPNRNTHTAVRAMMNLFKMGFAPICPHLSHFAETMFPDDMGYEDWMELDFNLIKNCDAIYRLPGVSCGAEREVKWASVRGIPVFINPNELIKWKESLCGLVS